MHVIHNFFTTKSEVLRDIDRLDLWPTTYVSERMQELPLHWHDVDNCGYVLSGSEHRKNNRPNGVVCGVRPIGMA